MSDDYKIKIRPGRARIGGPRRRDSGSCEPRRTRGFDWTVTDRYGSKTKGNSSSEFAAKIAAYDAILIDMNISTFWDTRPPDRPATRQEEPPISDDDGEVWI